MSLSRFCVDIGGEGGTRWVKMGLEVEAEESQAELLERKSF